MGFGLARIRVKWLWKKKAFSCTFSWNHKDYDFGRTQNVSEYLDFYFQKNWLAPSWKTDILATLAKLFGIIYSSNINIGRIMPYPSRKCDDPHKNRKHHRFGSVFVGLSAFRKRNGAALASTRTFPKWMEQILDGRFGMRFLGGQNVGDSEPIFLIPKTSWHFSWKERGSRYVLGSGWLTLRFRIGMFFQVWLTVWAIQLPTGKKNLGETYKHHEENCRSWGKSHVFLSDKKTIVWPSCWYTCLGSNHDQIALEICITRC